MERLRCILVEVVVIIDVPFHVWGVRVTFDQKDIPSGVGWLWMKLNLEAVRSLSEILVDDLVLPDLEEETVNLPGLELHEIT